MKLGFVPVWHPKRSFQKGSKDVHEVSGGSGREFHTILAAGAADGEQYKGVNLYARWTSDGPEGASKGVHLVCLPPHTTHLLQPLDVGVYGPVKKTWKTIIKQHNLETQAERIVKEDFPGRQGMWEKPLWLWWLSSD